MHTRNVALLNDCATPGLGRRVERGHHGVGIAGHGHQKLARADRARHDDLHVGRLDHGVFHRVAARDARQLYQSD